MDAKLYVMIDSMNRDQLRNVMEANAQGAFASWPIDVLRAKVREGYESGLLEPATIIEPRAGEHTKGPWQLHHKGAGGWVFAHPKFGHLDARSIGTDKEAAHQILAVLNTDQVERERALVEACEGLLSIMKRLNVEIMLGDAPTIFAAKELLAKHGR